MATFAATDIALMLQTKAGERDGFDQLVERYRRDLVGYLYRMVYNHAIAEELAQEAFLRAYRSRERYEPSAKFTTWLYRIATRVALNWIRDNRRVVHEPLEGPSSDARPRQVADPGPAADVQVWRATLVQALRDAIQRLPERQRSVVVMHKYHDMTYEEIAGVMGCTPQAVKATLFRAHSALRDRLQALT
jgi:RNA polymerase sigma-70 factor (ECF subfamily)